ncbi:MAG: hypothetical protein ACI4OW_04845 [Alphaproteobacteria bacterium]
MNNAPDHFSHSYELKVDHRPTQKSDRIALRILYPGLLLGMALVILGVYEFFYGFPAKINIFGENVTDEPVYESLINPYFFDAVVTLLGLGIIISLIFSYIRYKKVALDDKGNVIVVHRPVFGEKKTYKDKIKNYEGVRLRIEFFQFGMLNKNKYIIELYHKNSFKTIPLYISTSGKYIRKKWEYYARMLNMPTLIMTDEGMVSRDIEDLNKSIKEMAEKWHLANQFDDRAPLPPTIAYVRKADKTVIKARKIRWDAYNLIMWFCIFVLGSAFIMALTSYLNQEQERNPWVLSGYAAGILFVLALVYSLFRKDKIVIKREKIIIVHKFMLFSRKKDELRKDKIEAIDVTFNPATERYFVAIASDEKTLVFGKKLPIDDLRWVKKFLINEVIK